jgi:hypothetical protein
MTIMDYEIIGKISIHIGRNGRLNVIEDLEEQFNENIYLSAQEQQLKQNRPRIT